MSIPRRGGTKIHVLGSFFSGFQFRSYFDRFLTFVETTGWTGAVRQNTLLTLWTFLGIHQLYVVLLTGTIATMSGVSLLW